MTKNKKRKKVVSMTGEYAFRNYTVKDIKDLKGVRQLTKTLPFLPDEAKAAEISEIDMMNTRYNYFYPENAIKIRCFG